jgi:hypothetical protein
MPSKDSVSASMRACDGSSFISARAVRLLPEPLSPTMPSFSVPSVDRYALDRRREAGAALEADMEVLDIDKHAVSSPSDRERRAARRR